MSDEKIYTCPGGVGQIPDSMKGIKLIPLCHVHNCMKTAGHTDEHGSMLTVTFGRTR